MITKKTAQLSDFTWLRGPDLNRRPSGYEPDELPLLHPAMMYAYYCFNGAEGRI